MYHRRKQNNAGIPLSSLARHQNFLRPNGTVVWESVITCNLDVGRQMLEHCNQNQKYKLIRNTRHFIPECMHAVLLTSSVVRHQLDFRQVFHPTEGQ